MNKMLKLFLMSYLIIFSSGLNASIRRKLNRKKVDLSTFLDRKRFEREKVATPSYILLPDLLNLNFEDFSNKLSQFARSRISFHDFNSRQPGRSLYFLFAGLLSVLKNSDEFDVKIHSPYYTKGAFSSTFFIYKKNESDEKELFLKIYLKGSSLKEPSLSELEEEGSKFLSKDKDDCSYIRIFYKKNKILTNFKKKLNQDLIDNFDDLLFDDFDLFTQFFSFVLNESNGLYVKDLFNDYRVSDDSPLARIYNEMDLHLFTYGMISNVKNLTVLNSNVERGGGRLDILVKYRDKENRLIKYVVELKGYSERYKDYKWFEGFMTDDEIIAKAFKQIDDRGYQDSPTVETAKFIGAALMINLDTRVVKFAEKRD
jgi:hypothetical protein